MSLQQEEHAAVTDAGGTSTAVTGAAVPTSTAAVTAPEDDEAEEEMLRRAIAASRADAEAHYGTAPRCVASPKVVVCLHSAVHFDLVLFATPLRMNAVAC